MTEIEPLTTLRVALGALFAVFVWGLVMRVAARIVSETGRAVRESWRAFRENREEGEDA